MSDKKKDNVIDLAAARPRSTAKKFLRGKKITAQVSSTAKTADYDPLEQAKLVGAAWHRAAEGVIACGVLTMESLQAFGDDPERLDAFLAGLVEAGVLSQREADLRLESPKLVKLRTVGENAGFLRRPEIAPHLGPGYSTIYQLILLYKELPYSDVEQKLNHLVSILQNCPGEITRDYLSDETGRIKQSEKAAKAKQAATTSATKPEGVAAPVVVPQQVGLALLTPRERDLKNLRADYADITTLNRCLPFTRALRQSENVAVVIAARMSDLPMIAQKLLPLCGFARPSRILLTRQPKSPDVTDAEVIITADRGDRRFDPLEDGVWLDDAGTADLVAIVARLYPDVDRRLHVFAPAQAEGWSCLVGEEAWAENPSLR